MPDVAVHLVSAPWAPPHLPSIQTGALKAYLDRAFEGRPVRTRAHAAFYSVLHRAAGTAMHEFFDRYSPFGEALFLLLYSRRFGLPNTPLPDDEQMLDRISGSEYSLRRRVSRGTLERLEAASIGYVEETLLPALSQSAVNFVGFTLNYDQVYASLFLAQQLLRAANGRQVVLLFGGASVMLPNTMRVLRWLGIRAWCFLGEGERKLEAVIEAVLRIRDLQDASIAQAIGGASPGVVHTFDPPPGLITVADRSSQLGLIEDLPVPDYSDYFDAVGVSQTPAPDGRRAVVFEGSRGCVGRCDFCGLNSQWQGFRKKSGGTVLRGVLELCDRHSASDVQFVDNICDTWAEQYAREMVRRNRSLSGFMELRASHPETFWTRLALAGLDRLQIGAEALSPPLLEAIGKGTRVYQNIAVQKYLKELGIDASAMLMGHHPHSTLADVAETRRILESIPHLAPFGLTRCRISLGSPLYNQLTYAEKEALRLFLTHPLSNELDRFQVGCWFELPERLGPRPDVREAWDEFRTWYLGHLAEPDTVSASLTVQSHSPGKWIIRDARWGRYREGILDGVAGVVFELCHTPRTAQGLADLIGFPQNLIRGLLSELGSARWVIESEGHFISLALRSREVLIRNLQGSAAAFLPARAEVGLAAAGPQLHSETSTA